MQQPAVYTAGAWAFLFLVLLMAIQGCKTTAVTTATVPPSGSAAHALLDSMHRHAFYFEWLTGKARVEITDGANKTSFTASLRMRRDSAIWISISPVAGIEAARALLTRDSIRVIDRMNNDYYSKGYDFFSSFTSLPVTFEVLQDLITGVPVYTATNSAVVVKADSIYLLDFSSGSRKNTVTLNRSFLNVLQTVKDSSAADLTISQQYEIPYTDPFSLWRKIEMRHPQAMQIIITFSKIKLNEPVKLPFTLNE